MFLNLIVGKKVNKHEDSIDFFEEKKGESGSVTILTLLVLGEREREILMCSGL